MNIKNKGFTIVELLVVIVVIGILASITIVGYTGISNKAVVASIQSDLSNISKKLKLFQVSDPSSNYPVAINCSNTASNEICINPSGNNSLSGGYTVNNASNPKTFTIEINNGSFRYQITESTSPTLISASTPVTAVAAITGTTTSVGSVLTSGATTPGGATVSYQWQIATTAGGTYSNILGAANSNTYTLSGNDLGKYIKVLVTGTGTYTGSQLSVASAAISDANWTAGVAATVLEGKWIRKTDVATNQHKTTGTPIDAPQGVVGLDPTYPAKMVLVDPQNYRNVDFSLYPAQTSCKAVGGRVPNVQELSAIYTNRVIYGNNFSLGGYYWASTEYTGNNNAAYMVDFNNGSVLGGNKNGYGWIRCVAG